MQVLIAAAVVVATIAAMEFIAASVHRYVMHGWGWGWHRSHHRKRGRGLEKNDLYAVVFALPALLLTALASPAEPAYWCGIGVALYGLLYAIVHDGLVHRRLPFRLRVQTRYLRRLVEAHHLHHAVRGRDGCVSFGFLYAPPVSVVRKHLGERLKAKAAR